MQYTTLSQYINAGGILVFLFTSSQGTAIPSTFNGCNTGILTEPEYKDRQIKFNTTDNHAFMGGEWAASANPLAFTFSCHELRAPDYKEGEKIFAVADLPNGKLFIYEKDKFKDAFGDTVPALAA